MDEKISWKAVDQYATLYANQLTDSFFSKKDKIRGSEILTLSEIKQVNLFIINDLLHVWKEESQKLHSPYFDYQAKPVVESLIQFQNTLSNHILINRVDFLPLLRRATSKTLNLILAPYDFFSEVLDEKGQDIIATTDLRNKVKYIKINRPPLENLVTHLEQKRIESLTGKEAFALLDHILEEVNFTPEDIEPYLESFNKIVPLNLDKFYEHKSQPSTQQKGPEAKSTTSPVNPSAEAKPTLAEDLAKKKITRLKESLTINQKFMFTKILFHGDFEIFTEAIDKIDRFDNLTQAIRYLEQNYPDWDRESEEYEEFVEILQNRFS